MNTAAPKYKPPIATGSWDSLGSEKDVEAWATTQSRPKVRN